MPQEFLDVDALDTLAAIDDGVVAEAPKRKRGRRAGDGGKWSGGRPRRGPVPQAPVAIHQLYEAMVASPHAIYELEARAGVGYRYAYRMNKGDYQPTLPNLEALANTVGLTVRLVPMEEG